MTDINEVIDHKGEKATFVINVQYRQHASWQGKVTWLEAKKKCSFRSALELIKLMDSVVQNPEYALADMGETDEMEVLDKAAE